MDRNLYEVDRSLYEEDHNLYGEDRNLHEVNILFYNQRQLDYFFRFFFYKWFRKKNFLLVIDPLSYK